jgi:hypothetical protein
MSPVGKIDEGLLALTSSEYWKREAEEKPKAEPKKKF